MADEKHERINPKLRGERKTFTKEQQDSLRKLREAEKRQREKEEAN